MMKKVYDSGRVIVNAQDGSREFISLLASICVNGIALLLALIYKGALGDLQDTWLEDLNEKQHTYFASLTNKWSSNAFGMMYLVDVFDLVTRAKVGYK
jgi:hypothetical protein